MCDASDYAVGAVFGQQVDKKLIISIIQARHTWWISEEFCYYREIVSGFHIACDKFRPYIVDSKITVHTDHSAIKYLINKKDAKPKLIRCVILLQEFDSLVSSL
jgi:hypothetical protein